MKGMRLAALLAAACWASGVLGAQVSISGIMGDKALISVDGGPPKVVRAGEEYQGVRILDIQSGKVTVEDAGRRFVLGLGSGIGAGAGSTPKAGGDGGMALDGKAALHADSRGHFSANVQVNGVSSRFMVDTGASSVALPLSLARRAGVSLPARPNAAVSTANGMVRAYRVTLNEVRLEGIKLYQVEGLVMEDGQLGEPLLGMSFLNRTAMQRDGDLMSLRRRY